MTGLALACFASDARGGLEGAELIERVQRRLGLVSRSLMWRRAMTFRPIVCRIGVGMPVRAGWRCRVT